MTAAATTVAVAVVLSAGRVLVGVRGMNARDAAGRREFPGGKLEDGETPAAAAARECLEETGIDVLPGDVLDVARGTSSAGPLEVVFIAAAPRGGGSSSATTAAPAPAFPVPRPPFAWVPLGSLDAAEFPAANARVVELLRTGHLAAPDRGPRPAAPRHDACDHGGS